MTPLSVLSFYSFFITRGERTERVWSKGGKSEGFSNRMGNSKCVPTHRWRPDKRGITEKCKGCGPWARVRARNSAAWGWAAPNATRTGEKVWD